MLRRWLISAGLVFVLGYACGQVAAYRDFAHDGNQARAQLEARAHVRAVAHDGSRTVSR